jgi:hypothetical protein
MLYYWQFSTPNLVWTRLTIIRCRKWLLVMLEHFLSHLLSRKVERHVDGWVNSGRRPDRAIALDSERVRMAFGFRYRFQNIMTCLVFGIVFGLGCWLQGVAPAQNIWLALLCLAFFGALFLLSTLLALYSLTTEVIVSPQRLTVRAFFMIYTFTDWDNVCSVYRSPVHSSIVLVTSEGRRIRISTKLDGLRAMLPQLATLKPGVVDHSIIQWMISDT